MGVENISAQVRDQASLNGAGENLIERVHAFVDPRKTSVHNDVHHKGVS